MDVNEIKALISPNRPGGVSATELDRACRMLDEFDGFTREAVAGLVDISRRERARAEAAEADAAKSREYADMLATAARALRSEINDLVRENAQLRRTAEARIAQIVALLGDAEKRIMPGKSNEEWLEAVEAWRDAS
jgi:flagellar biosynthesis regulator FlaF